MEVLPYFREEKTKLTWVCVEKWLTPEPNIYSQVFVITCSEVFPAVEEFVLVELL